MGPSTQKGHRLIRKGKQCATCFIKKDYNPRSSVTWMIQDLSWSDLAHRWRNLRLALLYKVVFRDYVVTAEDLQLAKANMQTRANYPNKLRHIRPDSIEILNFFPIDTVEGSNQLPALVIVSPSPASNTLGPGQFCIDHTVMHTFCINHTDVYQSNDENKHP